MSRTHKNRNVIARLVNRAAKQAHLHRERLDSPKGDDVIIPATYFKLGDYKRPHDKYDQMFFDRLRSGKIPERKPS
jgi:hypothetical protein